MMTHDEMIAVIAAHRDGKTIESRLDYGTNREWRTAPDADTSWDFDEREYRIKPEPPKPREWWICCGGAPSEYLSCAEGYPVRQMLGSEPYPNQIHVREVLPEGEK